MTGRGKEEGPGSNYYIAEQQRGPSRHTGGIQDWGYLVRVARCGVTSMGSLLSPLLLVTDDESCSAGRSDGITVNTLQDIF